jgi:hypothetical protein
MTVQFVHAHRALLSEFTEALESSDPMQLVYGAIPALEALEERIKDDAALLGDVSLLLAELASGKAYQHRTRAMGIVARAAQSHADEYAAEYAASCAVGGTL